MTKRLTFLFFLTLLMVAVLALTADARSVRERAEQPDPVEQVQQYSFMNEKATAPIPDETAAGSYSGKGGSTSLGTAGNGFSPGFIIGTTHRDYQKYANPYRMVDWRATEHVHFAWYKQNGPSGGSVAEYILYRHFNPYQEPDGGFCAETPLQSSPLARAGGYQNLDVDTLGHAMVVCRERNHNEPYPPYLVYVYWDLTGVPAFAPTAPGLCVPPHNDDTTQTHPRIEYQAVGGSYVTHVLAHESPDSTDPGTPVFYYRKPGYGPTGVWTCQKVIDTAAYESWGITASRSSEDVAISWVQDINPTGDPDRGASPRFKISNNMGSSWGPAQIILDGINFEENQYVAWIECSPLYDTDGYLHIVWNANLWDAEDQAVGGRTPSRVQHWTNRKVGPYAGGSISTVYHSDANDYVTVCGGGGWNTLDMGKPVISECNDRLYCIWSQYVDLSYQDPYEDCANQDRVHSWNSLNAEIYMAVSQSLEGSLWDDARNLTRSHSPNCDTLPDPWDADCDHDTYASMSRYGMNVDTGTNWGAVKGGDDATDNAFAVRDYLEPTFPDDSIYLDVQYINDLIPDNAMSGHRDESDGIWTNNPVKWFRLPCVAPVVEPNILVAQEDYLYPDDWVKSGQADTLDVTVENLGNDTLHVDSIRAENQDPTTPAWLAISPSSAFNVDPGSQAPVEVIINDAGLINPPSGTAVEISADVVFYSDDPDEPSVSFAINSIVTDSVAPILWDTVYTDWGSSGIGLTAATNGNAGNVGIGRVNLDFVDEFDPSVDCNEEATVYLYDATPLMMRSTVVGDYFWQPFWTPARSDPDFNFQPVPYEVESTHDTQKGCDHFVTGTFVTADSTIGCTKHWYAPLDSVSYVIERWDIYSMSDTSYNDVRLGQWIDWDIPTDVESNNFGGIVPTEFYVWQRGIDDPGEDPLGCTPSANRYGGSGLLGWYYDSEALVDDSVNHDTLYGGYVLLDESLFAPDTDSLIPEYVWDYLNTEGFSADNSEAADQQIVLGFGSFTISQDDTLRIWVVHASEYDGDLVGLDASIDSAKVFYGDVLRGWGSCCGVYTNGYTGNINYDDQGKRNLADITVLIDHVYLTQAPLPCHEEGDTNGDGKPNHNLADITRLIDHVYISQDETELCQ
jgi:hypothetical protein